MAESASIIHACRYRGCPLADSPKCGPRDARLEQDWYWGTRHVWGVKTFLVLPPPTRNWAQVNDRAAALIRLKRDVKPAL